jgi:hypothetical protein
LLRSGRQAGCAHDHGPGDPLDRYLPCAERTSEGGEDRWRVSWLAGRVLSAGQAEAAMLIAEAACGVDADCDPELYDEGFWSRLDAWADQLGMPGPAALAQASAALAGELTPGANPSRTYLR